jgi:hypothetical protein
LNTVYAAAPDLFLVNIGMLFDARHDILQLFSCCFSCGAILAAMPLLSDSTDSAAIRMVSACCFDDRLSPDAQCSCNFSFVLLSSLTPLHFGRSAPTGGRSQPEGFQYAGFHFRAVRAVPSDCPYRAVCAVPPVPYRPTYRSVPAVP